jgi:hypothetical protein
LRLPLGIQFLVLAFDPEMLVVNQAEMTLGNDPKAKTK